MAGVPSQREKVSGFIEENAILLNHRVARLGRELAQGAIAAPSTDAIARPNLLLTTGCGRQNLKRGKMEIVLYLAVLGAPLCFLLSRN
jgi:hypothetical protein